MLNHVEREVIKSAKAPDTYTQQQNCPEPWVLENKDSGGHEPSNKEQKALGQNDSSTFQVSKHDGAIRKGRKIQSNMTAKISSDGRSPNGRSSDNEKLSHYEAIGDVV